MPKPKNIAQRVASRVKTSKNLKNATLTSRVKASVTEIRKTCATWVMGMLYPRKPIPAPGNGSTSTGW
jgi:hypothetical protein